MRGQRLLAMRFSEDQLRFDVTMPVGTEGCEMDGSTDLNAGLLLSLWHRPFLGCKHCWQSRDSGSHKKAWWKHVWETTEHQDILTHALKHVDGKFLSCPGSDLKSDREELTYALLIGAMTRKERANPFGVPRVGHSVDRRTLLHLGETFQEDKVK